MAKYALAGSFNAHTGKRDELITILMEASALVSGAKGCHHYIIYKDSTDENTVWVTEIWDSKEDHDNSLHIPGCRELISQAMPLINGRPVSNQLEVVGGKGTG